MFYSLIIIGGEAWEIPTLMKYGSLYKINVCGYVGTCIPVEYMLATLIERSWVRSTKENYTTSKDIHTECN